MSTAFLGTNVLKRNALASPATRRTKSVAPRALFGLFNKKDKGQSKEAGPGASTTVDESSKPSTSSSSPSTSKTTTTLDLLDEVVLIETDSGNGSKVRIVYRNGGTVDAYELDKLCEKVGWPRRPIHKVEAALKNSFMVATLILETGSYGADGNFKLSTQRLVGLSRATSDHAFNATIWDVLVDPEFQGQGLGKSMVEHMVRSLLRREIGNITLFADAQVVDFYRGLGFEADPEGIKGMFWYPKL